MNIFCWIGLVFVLVFSITLFWAWSLCAISVRSDEDRELEQG